MSYARARLWIGISGVGLIVVACVVGIVLQLPQRLLPTSDSGIIADLGWLVVAVGFFVSIMAPLDFWGGYFAPKYFNQQPLSLRRFLKQWLWGVIVQSLLFVSSSVVILALGRSLGLLGAAVSVVFMSMLYVAWQSRLVSVLTGERMLVEDDKVNRSLDLAEGWGVKRLPVTIIQSTDLGFTGGVLGLPHFESIIIPRNYVDQLTSDQLAVVLARRMIAVESGSRSRGIAIALTWIVTGFCLSAALPGAGVTSMAQLVSTCLGFTVWTFLGLLTLPTLSRQSSYAIDSELLRRGADRKTFTETISALDSVQDHEPSRQALIETIFHPVPSVDNRRKQQQTGSPFAWHAARMTLFLSWSCMGLLARAVHCNVGRPELWAMLPTD